MQLTRPVDLVGPVSSPSKSREFVGTEQKVSLFAYFSAPCATLGEVCVNQDDF